MLSFACMIKPKTSYMKAFSTSIPLSCFCFWKRFIEGGFTQITFYWGVILNTAKYPNLKYIALWHYLYMIATDQDSDYFHHFRNFCYAFMKSVTSPHLAFIFPERTIILTCTTIDCFACCWTYYMIGMFLLLNHTLMYVGSSF